jgi:hypothetical protein
MWELVGALDFLRILQFVAYQEGYNALLGGSVLNKGYSYNDLDIMLMPRGSKYGCDLPDILKWFSGHLYEVTGISDLPNPARSVYRLKNEIDFKEIDLIVVLE